MMLEVELSVHLFVIKNASDQKAEMERIQRKMAQEMEKIEERKAKIDNELKEVQVLQHFSGSVSDLLHI